MFSFYLLENRPNLKIEDTNTKVDFALIGSFKASHAIIVFMSLFLNIKYMLYNVYTISIGTHMK